MANKKNRRAVPTPTPAVNPLPGPAAAKPKNDMLRNPIAMNDYEAIQQMRMAASMAGVRSFILLFPTTDGTKQGDLAIHLENIAFRTALNGMITGLNYAINVELERHPEFSKEYKDMLMGFMEGIFAQVRATNDKLALVGK